ncbi:hypothetical protein M3Y99_00122600 [Aphelenchoides fujianensis]|nr:hypothetical protein M3Y99_00122600 [Aphelenchoides fujianensis]
MSVQLLLSNENSREDLEAQTHVPPLQLHEFDVHDDDRREFIDAAALMSAAHSAESRPSAIKMMTQMSSDSGGPPSYEEVVNQEQVEKTQRRIWGAIVVYVSHLCGIHPLRAPYFCSLTECKKLSIWDRLSWFNIFICLINLFVSLNHIYLRFFSENSKSLWSSNDKARWIQTFVSSIGPPLIIIASTFSSPGLDRLIHLISNEKIDISQSQNKQRIRKWFNIMFWLNFSFAVVCIAQLSQIIFMDFIRNNFRHRTVLDSDFIEMHATKGLCIKRFLYEVDRRYFNIMSFAVVKIPQVLIIVICIELSVLYRENTNMIAKRRLTRDRLKEFFDQFRRLETIHAQLEATYNRTILLVVLCMLSIGTVKTYVLMRYLAISPDRLDVLNLVFDTSDKREAAAPTTYACIVEITFTLLGIVLNFVWTIGFVLSCVYCNDTSRSSMSVLLNKLVDDDAKPTKDQILQKLNSDYGLTMGKFMRMDRSAVVTMISIVFTVVAVWLQVGTDRTK